MDAWDDGRYDMLYCDTVHCRVNTFERGQSGDCPGCMRSGLPIPAGAR